MNANELAKGLEVFGKWVGGEHKLLNETATMLRQQQAENDALQAKYEADYAKAFENGYAIGLSHGKDLVNNG